MWIEANPGPAGGKVGSAPAEVVASAFKALGKRDRDGLMALLHPEIEFQPVNALGLREQTGRGHEDALRWMDEIDREGTQPWLYPRTIEDVGGGVVLVSGIASEQARTGERFASSVAWLVTVRGGLIVSSYGYPDEAAARRAAADRTS
jgi:ketosteroid isomerase-like protein